MVSARARVPQRAPFRQKGFDETAVHTLLAMESCSRSPVPLLFIYKLCGQKVAGCGSAPNDLQPRFKDQATVGAV